MKMRFAIALVLTLPKATQGLVVNCGAFRVCWDCVLMQNGKFIDYAFRQLKDPEKNYPTHDLDIVL